MFLIIPKHGQYIMAVFLVDDIKVFFLYDKDFIY